MSYYSEVMADSPGVYLRLDEPMFGDPTGNTVATDSSGNGLHGTIENSGVDFSAPSLVDGGVGLNMGKGGSTGGVVLLPDLPQSDDWTIEFLWQPVVTSGYLPSISFGRQHYYTGFGGLSSMAYHQIHGFVGQNQLSADTFSYTPDLEGSSTYRRAASWSGTNSLAVGVKQHIALVRGGLGRTNVIANPGESLLHVYVNGVYATGLILPGGYQYPTPTIDAWDAWNPAAGWAAPTSPSSAYAGLPPLRFQGSAAILDEIAYYPTALSAARVLAHSNAKGTNLLGGSAINLRAFTASGTQLVVPAKLHTSTAGANFRAFTTTAASLYVQIVVQTPEAGSNVARFTTGYIDNPIDSPAPEITWPDYGEPNTPSAGLDPSGAAGEGGFNITVPPLVPALSLVGVLRPKTATFRIEDPLPPAYLTIVDPTLDRVPTVATVLMSGLEPFAEVTFTIGVLPAGSAVADVSGDVMLHSVEVGGTLAAGTHTLTGTTDDHEASADFTLARSPANVPVAPTADATPVLIPEALGENGVYRWVLQDLMPGGLGSWVMTINPASMSNPHVRKNVGAVHTTSVVGRHHVSEGASPLEWEFAGFCPDQAFYTELVAYSELPRRFTLIDHRNRAWTVAFAGLDMRPRKRIRDSSSGLVNDWAADYSAKVVLYSQQPQTPVAP